MEAIEFLNAGDPLPYESISGFDRTHRVAASGIAELPFGRGAGSPMICPAGPTLSSAAGRLPMSCSANPGRPLGSAMSSSTVISRTSRSTKDERDVDRWFNTDAGFNRNAAQQLASNVRTFPLRFSGLRGDDQQRWDFSLSKKFIITERVNASYAGKLSTLSTTSISVRRTRIRPTPTSGE